MKRPYCVVLTGGAGCGKSLVSSAFAKLGVLVVDTDSIARELTAPGGAAMAVIREEFGPGYVLADGSLDRSRMRAAAFGDPTIRSRLEKILHPMIRVLAGSRLAESRASYVLLVVPLFVESGAYGELADRVLVVDCSPEQQIERIVRRDNVSESIARAMLAAQTSSALRLARADDVLDNRGDPATIEARVGSLHRQYLQLAEKMAN